jgi:hypothetical protein
VDPPEIAAPDGHVLRAEVVDLVGEVRDQGVPGSGGFVEPVTEHRLDLALGARGDHALLGQLVGDQVQQVDVAIDQLDLPLAPAHGRAVGQPTGHLVVADLREHRTVVAQQRGGGATRADRRDHAQVLTTGVGAHQVPQGVRGRLLGLTQRLVHLVPSRADRQLQVPALVATAGASSQRDARTDQRQVGGVEVGRLEVDDVRRADRGHGPHPGEVGHRRTAVDREGALDLVVVAHPHIPIAPDATRSGGAAYSC